MIGLLQTLARHPVIRTVDVHTAAAALEELIQLENCLVPRCSAASFDLGVNSTTCGLSFSSEDSNNPSTAWASGLEPEEQWRIAMLKNAYAESAGRDMLGLPFGVVLLETWEGEIGYKRPL